MKRRKGFTLVELLVVIAILAILATVTVVSYNSFTDKAKESNDKTLVRQINDVLFAESQTSSSNILPSEALKKVMDSGINLAALTPTKEGNQIVWNQDKDRFYLLNSNDEVIFPEDNTKITTENDHRFWKICNSYTDFIENNLIKNTFSLTFVKDVIVPEDTFDEAFPKRSYKYTFETKVGIDSNGSKIKKENSSYKKVDRIDYLGDVDKTNIRIDDSDIALFVDNSKADIDVYGNFKGLTVNESAYDCVNFYGTTKSATVNKGKLRLMPSCVVNGNITSGNASNNYNAQLEIYPGAEINGDIDINSGDTKLLENSEVKGKINMYVGSLDCADGSKIQNDIIIKKQIKGLKISSKTQVNNILIDSSLNEDEINNKIDNKSEVTPVISNGNGTKYFAGGLGTLEKPYLIKTLLHLRKAWSYPGSYFKICNDIIIEDKDVEGYNDTIVLGEYSGFNLTADSIKNIKIIDNTSKELPLFNQINNCNISNITFDLHASLCKTLVGKNEGINNISHTFTDVTFNSVIKAANNNGAICQTAMHSSAKFNNVKVNLTLKSDGGASRYNAAFIGRVTSFGEGINFQDNKLVFNKCSFNGTISSGKAAIFVGNVSSPCVVEVAEFSGNYTIFASEVVNNQYAGGTYFNPYFAQYTTKATISAKFGEKSLTIDQLNESLADFKAIQGSNFKYPDESSLDIKLNEDKTVNVTASSIKSVASYAVEITWSLTNQNNENLTIVLRRTMTKEELEGNNYLKDFNIGKIISQDYIKAHTEITKVRDYNYEIDGVSKIIHIYKDNGNEYYYDVADFTDVQSFISFTTQPVAYKNLTVIAYDAEGNLLVSKSK